MAEDISKLAEAMARAQNEHNASKPRKSPVERAVDRLAAHLKQADEGRVASFNLAHPNAQAAVKEGIDYRAMAEKRFETALVQLVERELYKEQALEA